MRREVVLRLCGGGVSSFPPLTASGRGSREVHAALHRGTANYDGSEEDRLKKSSKAGAIACFIKIISYALFCGVPQSMRRMRAMIVPFVSCFQYGWHRASLQPVVISRKICKPMRNLGEQIRTDSIPLTQRAAPFPIYGTAPQFIQSRR